MKKLASVVIATVLATGAFASVATTAHAGKKLSNPRPGIASWYGGKFHGRKTASGRKFDQFAMTAAHPSLPFKTKVKVTNKGNGRSVVVEITDRGPHTGGRVIDLSKGAATRIGMSGTASVTLAVVR
jgi:rare lipoprotein A